MKAFFVITCLFLLIDFAHSKVEKGSAIKGLEGKNQEEQTIKLDDYKKEGHVLVYFFPKADTPGCTKQACSLRDSYEKLQKHGVKIFGVSTDSPKQLAAFKKKYKLPFDFISDPQEKWAKAFEVPVLVGFASRQAFLLKNGKVIWLDRSASTQEQAKDVLKALN